MINNIIKLVSREDKGSTGTSKKEVIDFLQTIIDEIESGKREPFDMMLVLGHKWDQDKDGFTLYKSRLGMSGLEAISDMEVAKNVIMQEILD